jgi:hypothetical protein
MSVTARLTEKLPRSMVFLLCSSDVVRAGDGQRLLGFRTTRERDDTRIALHACAYEEVRPRSRPAATIRRVGTAAATCQ